MSAIFAPNDMELSGEVGSVNTAFHSSAGPGSDVPSDVPDTGPFLSTLSLVVELGHVDRHLPGQTSVQVQNEL